MDKISRALPGTPLQHAKGTGSAAVEDTSHRSYRKRKNEFGLVGLVNVGNSCYMNATLQALSNCPPFRQYFIDCHHPGPNFSRAADVLSTLFKQIWTSERHPGHLSPRKVSSVMKNKMFRGVLQQDAQEFLRCLLSQVHEEIGLVMPAGPACGCGQRSCDCGCHRDSSISCVSHDSNVSNDSSTKLVGSSSGSPLAPKRRAPHSPTFLFRTKDSYSKLKGSLKSSLEKIHLAGQQGEPVSVEEGGPVSSQVGVASEGCVKWEEGDVFLADLETGLATLQREMGSQDKVAGETESPQVTSETTPTGPAEPVVQVVKGHGKTTPTDPIDPVVEVKGQNKAALTDVDGTCVDPSPEDKKTVVMREKTTKTKTKEKPRVVSIVSQVFEGVLESKVTCLYCKKVSVIHEPFHDLSLPIPGRKEMAKFNRSMEDSSEGEQSADRESEGSLSYRFCAMLRVVSTLARDAITGPPTDIKDCLNAFFDACELKGDNMYFCCHCKSFQNSKKQMSVVKLPEVLCIHLKRFRFDSYFSTKISRHISFPLTDLDMTRYLRDKPGASEKYNLDAVITHIGGAGGGHYIAFARNGLNNNWYEYNDTSVHTVTTDTVQSSEGYVLFYRRVPPHTSLSAQGLDVIDLLPKQGTTLPSPDVCYLSRHWLHLARHCAHPGPIFQHEYACKHGCVVRADLARSASMPVRREVWDQLQGNYRGGPLVESLVTCSQCQEIDLFLHCPYNLEQLAAKRAKEKDQIHQIQQSERGIKNEPYLLSKDWLQHWQSFIQCSTLDVLPPGPIDNTPLLMVGGADHTHKLADTSMYRKLSTAAWSYFHQAYGGGPVIVTSLQTASTKVETTV